MTWEYAGTISWVEVRLDEDARGGSTLELRHIYHPWPDFERRYGPGAAGVGWEQSLVGLDLYLRSPADAPTPAELEAWFKTEDGKTLIREASEGWANAAIAAGTAELAAREAAERTTAFYYARARGV